MQTAPTIHVPGGIKVLSESPNHILKYYGGLIARNAALHITRDTFRQKDELAREAAVIFAKDISESYALSGMTINEAIKAADYSDPSGNIGLLSGTLALQRALTLMQYAYPMLTTCMTDFTGEPGALNQTVMTRIVLTPSVQNYNTAPDSAGRPRGWDTVSPAQTVDVPVTLDEHAGVPLVFGSDILAATFRKLFAEVTPQALYALAGRMVNKLTTLFTPANYNAYAGTTLAAGATTNGSPTVTVTSTAAAYPGAFISGTGIPGGTFILAVVNGTTLTLNQNATATNAGLTVTLGTGKVPIPYATFASQLADFNFGSLGLIGAALSNNEVPEQDRYVMLNANYYQRLAQDPNFNTFFAAIRSPDIITKGVLPELNGLIPQKAPFFPSDNYRVGFAYHRSAAILKSRVPDDFTKAVNAMTPGSVTTVTDPATGLTMLLVQYINLQQGYAEWRPEVLLGAAVGERRGGLVLTSQ